MPDAPGWFFDTVVLSNFALAHRLDLLVGRYGRKGFVTQEVLAEISAGTAAGYALAQVEDAVAAKALSAARPMAGEERSAYRALLRSLSSGEASCIACARFRGGVVATDDRAARSYCGDLRVPVTGTIGILKACCHAADLTPHDADEILASMVRCGFYAPVARVSDLLG